MKFSIIVPIYNVEKYIEQCIESILVQTYSNYELILVDDGSTDKSGEICNKYKNYKNVKVFHKKNGGLSDARNYGLKKSSGDYVMFIDGDDYLYSNNALESINNQLLLSSSDILQYKMIYYYENTKKYIELKDISNISVNENVINELKQLVKDGCLSVSACDKVIKRKIIMTNDLFFEDGLYSEDIDWSLKLYLHIKKIDILNESIYVYRQQREGSITNKKTIKRSKDLLFIIKKWLDYKHSNESLKNVYYNYLAYQALILLTISNRSILDVEDYMFLKKCVSLFENYDENYKVKLFYKIYHIFGFKFSINILKLYLKLKNMGFIKI